MNWVQANMTGLSGVQDCKIIAVALRLTSRGIVLTVSLCVTSTVVLSSNPLLLYSPHLHILSTPPLAAFAQPAGRNSRQLEGGCLILCDGEKPKSKSYNNHSDTTLSLFLCLFVFLQCSST